MVTWKRTGGCNKRELPTNRLLCFINVQNADTHGGPTGDSVPLRYVRKSVADLKGGERRFFLIGTGKNVGPNLLEIDDGSGKIKIETEKTAEGPVRVFCFRDGEKIVGEIVQKIDEVDFNLFKKVEELYSG